MKGKFEGVVVGDRSVEKEVVVVEVVELVLEIFRRWWWWRWRWSFRRWCTMRILGQGTMENHLKRPKLTRTP